MTLGVVHAGRRWVALGSVGFFASGCGAQDDVVFQTFAVELDTTPFVVREGAAPGEEALERIAAALS